ncbi:MAG: LAGLIDADG family homing endonuclease [Candidatus Woesearchaeota archaeon]
MAGVDVSVLVPEGWSVRRLQGRLIEISYENKGRGNSPKPMIIPARLKIEEEFMVAVGMILGDGKLSADIRHVGFSSIDSEMIVRVLKFYRERFLIGLEHFTITIRCKEYEEGLLEEWAATLGVPVEKLKLHETSRTRRPSCEIQLSSTIFRRIFGNLISELMNGDFLKEKTLRRGFLRGLFAAEGNVGINDKRNYIVSIQFCLGSHEKNLACLLKKALHMEGIKHNQTVSGSSLIIRMTSWENYHKCWKINLFSANKRKEIRFLNKLQRTRFSCRIKPALQKRILDDTNTSRRQLMFLAKAHTSLAGKIINDDVLIKLEYLLLLARLQMVPLEEVKAGMRDFNVNDVTPIRDKEFIAFVVDVKACYI